MKVRLWGTRGSIPVSGPEFARHGGSTTCLEVQYTDTRGDIRRVVVDCGSGMADLADDWGDYGGTYVWQTHMHWDHIQGLPFFEPLYDPDNHFQFMAVDRDDRSLREVFAGQMSQPTFPVALDDLAAELSFERLPETGGRTIDELEVRWREMCHPSGSSAYRFEHDGAVFVFSGDVEVQQGCRDDLIDFADDAHVLVMDAQYFPDEYAKREGFGHSTPIDAVGIAEEAGIDRLYMTHHDPGHDDDRLDDKLEMARDARTGDVQVENARDGLELEIDSQSVEQRLLSDSDILDRGDSD
jgi:phosphoribosyl 1,2-cyclic phosphodiesterase